jgi:hypothetical protein
MQALEGRDGASSAARSPFRLGFDVLESRPYDAFPGSPDALTPPASERPEVRPELSAVRERRSIARLVQHEFLDDVRNGTAHEPKVDMGGRLEVNRLESRGDQAAHWGEMGREDHVAAALEDLDLGFECARRSAEVRRRDDIEDDVAGRGDMDGERPERTDVPAYADVDCKCAARKQRDRTSGEARERADREHGPGSHPATSVPLRFSPAFRLSTLSSRVSPFDARFAGPAAPFADWGHQPTCRSEFSEPSSALVPTVGLT